MTTPTTFGLLLRRHRLAAGLTQEGLAERAGLSARGVQELERGGRTAPRAETVRLLADALGLEAAVRASLVAAAHPELASPPLPASPAFVLPVPPTPLVGREREVAEACALLRPDDRHAALRSPATPAARLLTLTGPGGVGKTRLALAIAAEVAGDFPDGVAWVELAPLGDSSLVAVAVARALGIQDAGERPLVEALATSVAARRLLLVLDNFEHLLPAAPARRRVAGGRAEAWRSWRPAGRGCGCAASASCRWRPLAVPDGRRCRRRWRGWPGWRRSGCSSSGRTRCEPDFALTTANARGGGRDLPAAGRAAAGDRAGGGADQRSCRRRRCWRGSSGACRC